MQLHTGQHPLKYAFISKGIALGQQNCTELKAPALHNLTFTSHFHYCHVKSGTFGWKSPTAHFLGEPH